MSPLLLVRLFQITYVESFHLHLLVLVPGHCSLLLFHSLHSFISHLVDQIQIVVEFLLVLLLFIHLDPDVCQSYFHWYDGFSSEHQSKQCFSYWHSCSCFVHPQDIRQLFRPCTLCPFKPSFDNFEQASVRHFSLTISLRVSGKRVVILDAQILAKFSKLRIVKLLPIV